MNPPDFFPRLGTRFPSLRCLREPEDLLAYSYDGTATCQRLPRAVVFPMAAEAFAALLHFAGKACVPVVARGAGTGLEPVMNLKLVF